MVSYYLKIVYLKFFTRLLEEISLILKADYSFEIIFIYMYLKHIRNEIDQK